MNKVSSGRKGCHPATIWIFWNKRQSVPKRNLQAVFPSGEFCNKSFFRNAVLPTTVCFPEDITCWNQTAHLESASCSSKGKSLCEILRRWYSRTHEEPCLQGPRSRIPGRNWKIQAAKSLSRKHCLLYFAGKNGFPHHKQGRAVLYLDIKSSKLQYMQNSVRTLGIPTVFCSRHLEGFFHNTVLLHLVPLAKEKHFYLGRITHPHITFFAVTRLFIIFTI